MKNRCNETLQHGRAWHRHGHAVLALHSAIKRQGRFSCTCGDGLCTSPAKHPIAQLCPKGLNSATRDPGVLERWLRARPDMNLGVRTDGLAVSDIDPRHNGETSLARLEGDHGELAHTWRGFTGGGGEHIIFAAPDGVTIRNSAGRLGEGIDVRGHGGYIVAPPSLHISGRPYAWSVDHHPSETPLAILPRWVVERLTEPASGNGVSHWKSVVGDIVGEGRRNHVVASLAGSLLCHGIDERLTLELLAAWNMVNCAPPLSDVEIVKTVRSIAGAERRKRSTSWLTT